MTSIKFRSLLPGIVLASLTVLAQQPGNQEQQPGPNATKAATASKPAASEAGKTVDHAASYFHYSMAHTYEEMYAMSGRTEYINKAIDEFRQALENDPSSEFLNAGLAELYFRAGRIRDAVLEAQDAIKRDPNNLGARKLLGRIYRRSMGDAQAGKQSQEILRLALEQYEAIVKLEPGNAENHLVLGQLYTLNQDLSKGEAEFKAAIDLSPTDEEGVTNLAYLYNEMGDSRKALQTLESVPEPARTSRIYSALGYNHEQLKEYKKAIAAYRQAITLDRDNLDARRGLAQNLANDNQLDAALAQYKVVADSDPQDPVAPLRISEIYRHQGKLDLAMDSLKKAEALVPDSIEISYNQALILEAQGKYDDAADVLQKLIVRSTRPDGNYSAGERGNRALFLERLGNIYRQQGKSLLSLETYRKMIDLGGDEASRGYQEIIDAYREQKRWTEAGKIAREAVTRKPNDRALKLVLATQLADDGKAEEAIQIGKSLIKGPGDRQGYLGLSQIYSRLKRWKEAEDALGVAEKASERAEDKRDVRYFQAALLERQKKYDQAEQIFRHILQQDPNNSPTLNYLGYMMADRNVHLEEALTLIKKAVSLDPQNGAYLDSLGWAYFKLGNYDLAEENLRKAADKTPNDATIQDHLGELYGKTGKLKLAATHWERALNEWNKSAPADVDQTDVARVQKKLESTKVKLAQQKQ